jgi:hypothetical protein
MAMIATLQHVLSASLLAGKHLIIPPQGATDEQIALEETKLPRKLSHPHRRLMKQWNGLGLGIFTFFGCAETHEGIGALCTHQEPLIELVHTGVHRASILIGSTPAGQMYGEDEIGHIFFFNKGDIKKVANNLEQFICVYLFGEEADQFGGKEWKKALIQAGLLDASLSDVRVLAG